MQVWSHSQNTLGKVLQERRKKDETINGQTQRGKRQRSPETARVGKLKKQGWEVKSRQEYKEKDVKQSDVEAKADQCNKHKAIYLEYEWWAGLQLQHAIGAQGLEHGVWVVAKGLVYHQHGVHVVHDETDFIRTAAHLWEAFLRSGHRGRQTHHHGVVDDCAVLRKRQKHRQKSEIANQSGRVERKEGQNFLNSIGQVWPGDLISKLTSILLTLCLSNTWQTSIMILLDELENGPYRITITLYHTLASTIHIDWLKQCNVIWVIKCLHNNIMRKRLA